MTLDRCAARNCALFRLAFSRTPTLTQIKVDLRGKWHKREYR
ncbi:MAG: hypothetical protein JWQ50_982 [Caballeronia mineralivorans]|jgi:hypothetical protein|nr:hypothetical protein [Caballeronia mineralivorans]